MAKDSEKPERPELFTLEFWQHAITQMVHAAVAGLAGPLVANQAGFIDSVPWYAMWSSAGAGMVLSLAASFGSLTLPNRLPASFIKETAAELEAEREMLRLQRARVERERLRRRGEEVLVDDRHRLPEEPTPEDNYRDGLTGRVPERPTPEGDFLITGHPPERVERAAREENPRFPRAYSDEEMEEPKPPLPPRDPSSGRFKPREETTEDWPQGGRRGRESRDK